MAQLEHGTRETPLRKISITVFLLIVLATILSFANDSDLLKYVPTNQQLAIDWIFCVVWFVCAAWLIRRLQQGIYRKIAGSTKLDNRIATLWSRALSGIGYAFVLVVALHLLHIRVGSILVGGAVTGVLVGIGAQSTLSNLFAGFILFTVRPFSVGQTVTLRTYLFSGVEYSGTVSDISWYYTVLEDGTQRRLVPNSSVIASAITVISDVPSQIHTVPLPYNVSVSTFKRCIDDICDGDVIVHIKDFGENTYCVQVKLPEEVMVDVIREALSKCKLYCS